MWATLVVAIFVPTHHKNLHEMEEAQTKVLILGAGGVGAWAAKALKARGHEVVATTSSIDTTRALGCLGIEVLPWRWNGRGVSWEALIDVNATKWMVTVPPRTGMDDAVDFHAELQAAAEKANVALLMWTSSTAVYDPQKEGLSERTTPSIGSPGTPGWIFFSSNRCMFKVRCLSWPCGLAGCFPNEGIPSRR